MFKRFINTLKRIRYKEVVMPFLGFIAVLVAVGFVESRHEGRTIENISIHIDKEYDNYFIDDSDVRNLLTNNKKEELVGDNHARINLKELEKRVKKNAFAHNVEVYRDVKGDLIVDVQQCRPIARIMKTYGNDYYISDYGTYVPLSDRFTARVPIVDGSFTNKFPEGNFGKDTITKPYFELLTKIDADQFMKTLVSQISLDSDGNIYIYPQIGDQVFELGPPEDLDLKFSKIKIFYEKIIPVKGWQKYRKVNLKYHNQIITE